MVHPYGTGANALVPENALMSVGEEREMFLALRNLTAVEGVQVKRVIVEAVLTRVLV